MPDIPHQKKPFTRRHAEPCAQRKRARARRNQPAHGWDFLDRQLGDDRRFRRLLLLVLLVAMAAAQPDALPGLVRVLHPSSPISAPIGRHLLAPAEATGGHVPTGAADDTDLCTTEVRTAPTG